MGERNVLFVDDDKRILNAIKRNLRKESIIVMVASSAKEALEILEQHEICVIVADISMPQVDGVELLKMVEAKYPDVVRVALTGISDMESVYNIFEEIDLYKYITKPWDSDQLRTIISEAVEEWDKQRGTTE